MDYVRTRLTRRLGIVRAALSLSLIVLLAFPGIALANGKKHFKKGQEHARAERWDRAAEEYALAVADSPDNAEYRLSYVLALTNASLMLTKRGDALAAQKDYSGAYQAYRQAIAFDPTNELAGAKMNQMLRIQGLPVPEPGPETELLKTRYNRSTPAASIVPPQNRVRTDVVFRNTRLKTAIDTLADSLGLNIIYDAEFKDRPDFEFEAKNVTQAKALELILQTNKLFYVQADKRTIIIALDNPQSRARYQLLAVRTFYLRNADIAELRQLIASVVGTKQVIPIKQLNAITVKDTPNNIELIEALVASVDKDRAEVLIDVHIMEVNRNDLLRLGNQFQNDASTIQGGGAVPGLSFFGGVGAAGALRPNSPAGLFGPIGIALALPPSQLVALQTRGRSKLLASSQIHVLDSEQHTVRIGRRVPIQTAQFLTGTTVVTGGNQGGNPNNPGNVGGGGFLGNPATQYQYENVGLNLDIKPVVHEDQIQLTMKIETSDIAPGAGVGGNPIFTQRQLSSVASIKDGYSTLIAGISQTQKSNSRTGLPLIGLLPIIGRLFSVPQDETNDTDVVILVTPHILRAPVYSSQDHVAIPAGTQTAPERQISIEEILYRAQLEDAEAAAAAARATAPSQTAVDLPPVTPAGAAPGAPIIQTPAGAARPPVVSAEEGGPARQPQRPAPAQSPTEQSVQVQPAAADDEEDEWEDEEDEEEEEPPAADAARDSVMLRLSALQVASAGKPMMASVIGQGGVPVTSASIAIRFDAQRLRVLRVESSGLFDGKLRAELPFQVSGDVVTIGLDRSGTPATMNGQLFTIYFEVLQPGGNAMLAVVPAATTLVGVNGASVAARTDGQVQVAIR